MCFILFSLFGICWCFFIQQNNFLQKAFYFCVFFICHYHHKFPGGRFVIEVCRVFSHSLRKDKESVAAVYLNTLFAKAKDSFTSSKWTERMGEIHEIIVGAWSLVQARLIIWYQHSLSFGIDQMPPRVWTFDSIQFEDFYLNSSFWHAFCGGYSRSPFFSFIRSFI